MTSMWNVEANETEPDEESGMVEWAVDLVNDAGRRECFGGGYYFIGTDPDGDDFNQTIADAGKEADRRNKLLNKRKHQSWEK